MASGTMSRTEKGRVVAPPRLALAAARTVAARVTALPGVAAQAHWEIGSQTEVNGVDFYVGEEELGHIHLDGEAHVPVGATIAKELVAAKLAQRFRWSREFVVVDTSDVEAASFVFELRRAQIDGASDRVLRTRIAAARDKAA